MALIGLAGITAILLISLVTVAIKGVWAIHKHLLYIYGLYFLYVTGFTEIPFILGEILYKVLV